MARDHYSFHFELSDGDIARSITDGRVFLSKDESEVLVTGAHFEQAFKRDKVIVSRSIERVDAELRAKRVEDGR